MDSRALDPAAWQMDAALLFLWRKRAGRFCVQLLLWSLGWMLAPAAAVPLAQTPPGELHAVELNLGELETEPIRALTNHPRLERAFNAVLFGVNSEERFYARRTLRMAWMPKPVQPPAVSGPFFNPIDQFVLSKWMSAGLASAQTPPKLCDDAAFLRRVYLDIIGVIPTAEEARRFLGDAAVDRRGKLVDELLSRHSDYAAHWTAFWERLLAGQTGQRAPEASLHGVNRTWLFNSLAQNKPYDLMVAELIDPTLPGHRAAIQDDFRNNRPHSPFIKNDSRKAVLETAAKVARLFLGTHFGLSPGDHPAQGASTVSPEFSAFSSFFASSDMESGGPPEAAGQKFEPRFPYALPGAPPQVPPQLEERLQRVAVLLIDPANTRFAQTMVDRLWRQFLGNGLIESGGASFQELKSGHADLLNWLAYEFVRHGYDLKHLIRLMLSSRTYQLQFDPSLVDQSSTSSSPFFQSPSPRLLTPEQLLDSLHLAAFQNLEISQRALFEKESALGNVRFGDGNDSKNLKSALLQAINQEHVKSFIIKAPLLDPWVERRQIEKAAEFLFWASLSRPPLASQLQEATNFLAKISNDSTGLVEEIVWIEDALPAGAQPQGSAGADSWQWGSAPAQPVFSGSKSHTQGGPGEQRQHYFSGTSSPLEIGMGDTLFAYVYVDPNYPARQIMMQWRDSQGWEHRAFWGENLIRLGQENSPSRRHIGPMPPPGIWTRLEVPASDVGFQADQEILLGWSFDQLGGQVFWDKAGLSKVAKVPTRERLAEYLHRLCASPDFVEIH